jgi:hypothetical protein
MVVEDNDGGTEWLKQNDVLVQSGNLHIIKSNVRKHLNGFTAEDIPEKHLSSARGVARNFPKLSEH